MDAVIALIAAACMFSNPKVSQQDKITCMDYLVNCSVGLDAQVTETQTRKCIKEMKDYAEHGKKKKTD